MVKQGKALTVYLCLSFILFLATSYTIAGWIIYFLLLLPFYGIVLLLWWIFVIKNRSKTARIKHWIWSIVLVLQFATIIISPGNCYEINQGARCYSNLQILTGDVPRTGETHSVHWKLVEDAWTWMLVAYGVTLATALLSTSVTKNVNADEK